MHLPAPDSGTHVRHGPMEKTAELQFVKSDKEGWVGVKCVTNNAFLCLLEKKLIGRSIVTAYELGRDTTVELMIVED